MRRKARRVQSSLRTPFSAHSMGMLWLRAKDSTQQTVVVAGALAQNVFGAGSHTSHIAEKADDVLGTRQQRQIAEDDDAVETVVYQAEQAAKQPQKRFHRSSWVSCPENKFI